MVNTQYILSTHRGPIGKKKKISSGNSGLRFHKAMYLKCHNNRTVNTIHPFFNNSNISTYISFFLSKYR